MFDGFASHDLGDGLTFHVGHLPDALVWSPDEFALAWELHPEVRPTIFLHGRAVAIPRYQQAYGADYHFSGQTSRAQPVPTLLEPLLDRTQQTIHPALNTRSDRLGLTAPITQVAVQPHGHLGAMQMYASKTPVLWCQTLLDGRDVNYTFTDQLNNHVSLGAASTAQLLKGQLGDVFHHDMDITG